MFDLLDDTIVAISSPPGAATRGIVRCSGPDSLRLADLVFSADASDQLNGSGGVVDLRSCGGYRRMMGMHAIEADCAVPGEIYLFRAPCSYTRQDSVEFHLPGSPPVLAMLLERLISEGARHAQPGEFTARAFMSGRMDLTQVEGVAGIINARSDAQLRAARAMMSGRLGGRISTMQQEVAEVLALVEADIDFADEPIEFITPKVLRERVVSLADALDALAEEASSSELFHVLPHILLIGRSNAGKSTLMNQLSGVDRSICSPISGTTRDVLGANVNLEGVEAILLDAAGVDPDMQDLMALARDAAMNAARRVDLLCLVVDVGTLPDADVLSLRDVAPETPCVVVANKIDLLDDDNRSIVRTWFDAKAPGAFCMVSANTGDGLDGLRRVLSEAIDAPQAGIANNAILLTMRQLEVIGDARDALHRCIDQATGIGQTIDRADTLAFDLRDALESLGAVVGHVTTEDLLGQVFAKFCIGK